MVAQLSIGTSSERISLLDSGGFLLASWRPAAGGHEGTFGESVLADYRQLAAYRDITTVETFELKLRGGSADTSIGLTQDLRRMLRKALDYWTTAWQSECVYLQAQAQCESNVRYAVVVDGRMEEDDNPFAQPFMQAGGGSVMDNLTLLVERGPWLENAPGTGTAVELAARDRYDGRYYGNVDDAGDLEPTTAEGAVFIANKRNAAGLTDIRYWDESAGAWNGANLLLVNYPVDILPAVPAINDFVIFGIDTTVADSGPFCSLVFDIGTAIGAGATLQWRYKGAGDTDDPITWTELPVQDNTNQNGAMTGDAFDTTGVHSVHWAQPSDWDTSNPNPGVALGITGYWVCCYVTAGPAASAPEQQNRDIYTVTWPYVEIQSTETAGDIAALAKHLIRNQSDTKTLSTELLAHRIVCGLRSFDRGNDFTAYLNASDEQNPASITFFDGPGFSTDDVQSPTGRITRFTNIGADEFLCYWRILYTQSGEWFGRYHAFVRCYQTSGAVGDLELYLVSKLTTQASSQETPHQVVPALNDWTVVDLGHISIGDPSLMRADEVGEPQLMLYGDGDSVVDLDVYDLILIPVDEWAGDFINNGAFGVGYRDAPAPMSAVLTSNSALMIDSITHPRIYIRAPLTSPYLTGLVLDYYQTITNGAAIWQAGEQQRLWFLCINDDQQAKPEVANSVTSWRNNRYLSMRGDR